VLERGKLAHDAGVEIEESVGVRVRGASLDVAAAARDAEMDCRLEVRTAEERLRAITGRADSLTAAAASGATTTRSHRRSRPYMTVSARGSPVTREWPADQ